MNSDLQPLRSTPPPGSAREPGGALFAAGVSSVIELDDFDAIHVVSPAWDQLHSQVGLGRARIRLEMAQAARLQIGHLSRSPGVLVKGAPPPGASLLTILLEGAGIHAQGRLWSRDHIAYIPCGTEFDVISGGPHSVLALSIDPARLDEESMIRWGAPFPKNVSGPCLRLRNEASRRRLAASWEAWLELGCRNPKALLDGLTASRMESDLLGAVFDSIEPVIRETPSRPRRELAHRAERVIRASLATEMPIGALCEEIRSSPRSLHASFKAEFGIPPMAYRKALRLDAVRRDLMDARPGSTVTNIAAKWGFFRFGYFSADYRGMFGENPHKTLRRAGGTKAPPTNRRRIDPT